MDDLVVEFIAETNEALGLIDNDLIALEQNPNDKAIIGNLFRLVHTIK
jgi:two-component system chemotaxis sensor kinase CheA